MHSRRGQLDVHEFEGRFQGRPAHFKMTSVIGHVLSIDFLPQFQNWETTHPASLFDAGTKKSEANPKVMQGLSLAFVVLPTVLSSACHLPAD